MILDHIGIGVSDYDGSKAFYAAVLKPLGIAIAMEGGGTSGCGFGRGQKPEFWIHQDTTLPGPLHIAFATESRTAVDAFYRAALAAGARDNGPPGIRAHYHANYYGAFVLDPDGHNVEAVCHTPA